MNIVLHSHVKIKSFSLWRSISPCLVALDKIRMRHSHQTTRFASFNPERSVLLSLYDFSLHHTQTEVSFGLKTGLNSFRNDLYGNKISSRYHVAVDRCKEIYVDGMNLLRNESYSGIM